MQECDFQSDERFARRFTESKLLNKPYGPLKILQGLQSRGIIREQAQAVLKEFGNQEYWLKKAVYAGHPDAMVVLGNAYISGLSCVEKNINFGNKLLNKARSIYRSSPSIAYMAKRMLGELNNYSR